MLRPGHVVFLCALALLCIGVVMVSSAGMTIDPVSTNPSPTPPPEPSDAGLLHMLSTILFSRSTIYMGMAVAAMAGVSFFSLRRTGLIGETSPSSHARLGLTILMTGCLVLLVILASAYVPGLSRQVNGSRRWITLPGLRAISIQPSEIAKWSLILVIAGYGACRASLMPNFRRGLVPGLLGAGLVAGAVAKDDLGTGVLIAAVACVVLVAAGARMLHFLMFIPPAAAGFVLLIVTNPYRLTRIETFFNPYLQPQGSGYHMIQSMLAIAGGEGTGRGLGYGLQKFGYLPEDTTDFLFPVICEELGIAGAALVIFLYVALLWAGLSIIRNERSLMLKLIGVGVLATVGLQALINLVVVTGLGPTKGIALPLISSGGTGWILTAASLGLLVAIDRRAAEDASEVAPAPLPLSRPLAT
jgi:cell division protein FtsW